MKIFAGCNYFWWERTWWWVVGRDHSAPVRLRVTTAVTAFTTNLEVRHWRNYHHLTSIITSHLTRHYQLFLTLDLSHWLSWPAPPTVSPATAMVEAGPGWWEAFSLCCHETSRDSAALQPGDFIIINLGELNIITKSVVRSHLYTVRHTSTTMLEGVLSDESWLFIIHCTDFVSIFYSMQFRDIFLTEQSAFSPL